VISRPALLLASLLLLIASGAIAQPAANQSVSGQVSPAAVPTQGQLERIEHKLDELLRRLPPRSPDAPPGAGVPGTALPSPALPAAAAEAGGRGAPAANASAAPGEYRPGALAVVRPAPGANAVLAVPADSVGSFVYEGGTLRLDDLSSRGLRYRAPVGVELQGWLRVRETGRYQVAVDFGSPRAGGVFAILSCGVALWLEDRQVGQRAGDLNLSPGSGATGPLSLVLGAELQPGLYRMRLWIACARTNAPQPVPVTADLLLKAPSELNLRGVTVEDVVHREG